VKGVNRRVSGHSGHCRADLDQRPDQSSAVAPCKRRRPCSSPVGKQPAGCEHEVFEVLWLEARSTASKTLVASPAPLPPRDGDLRLCVRYGGQVKCSTRREPSVDMGRDANCAITIRDRRASRKHATIERRGEHFVLSDLSTNGTFVTINGENELFLRHEDFVLRGSGIIAFAASASSLVGRHRRIRASLSRRHPARAAGAFPRQHPGDTAKLLRSPPAARRAREPAAPPARRRASFTRTRQFVERGAGGHHIVDQQQSLAGEIGRAVEGAADVCWLVRARAGRPGRRCDECAGNCARRSGFARLATGRASSSAWLKPRSRRRSGCSGRG
jgi:hypothetical protein